MLTLEEAKIPSCAEHGCRVVKRTVLDDEGLLGCQKYRRAAACAAKAQELCEVKLSNERCDYRRKRVYEPPVCRCVYGARLNGKGDPERHRTLRNEDRFTGSDDPVYPYRIP